ncbi:hypothetical protein [Mycolicibacterium fortuitum]|uniref:hypothetical protein n=1 Tax=Mycolicibacterium fortuitum TaxID=1766 RepID=UPI000AD1D8CE|nr:hypothetical protein [Mycolicibacterium fortuitum]MDG5769421.1 hypothetical protein [Mycolicibacterium fortuitum]MDG5780530.1 hypothetical protein [Mycolicibacterium fortuitum]
MTEQNDDTGETPPSAGESWTNPFSVEYERRKAELLAMPGYRLKLDLDALGRAGHIMYKNAEELTAHATRFLTGRRFSRDMDDEFEKELVRFLHNYLTSIYSLIEAQRVVMRHCWGDGSEFEKGKYTDHRKASFETGEAEFMTELRNYCTHRSVPLPGITTTFSWGRGRPALLVNRLTLDRDALLTWKKWTAPAKAYLRAQEPQFDLGPVIESYVNTASAFFNWFVEEINERNAEIKTEFMDAGTALKSWYEEETGMNTEGYRKLFGPPDGEGNPSQRRGQRSQPKRTTKRKRRKK